MIYNRFIDEVSFCSYTSQISDARNINIITRLIRDIYVFIIINSHQYLLISIAIKAL